MFDYPISVLHDIKNAIMPAAATGQTVSVEANPAEIVGTALAAITPAVGQFVRVLRHAGVLSRHQRAAAAASWSSRSSRATRGCACCASGTTSRTIWSSYVGLVTMINRGARRGDHRDALSGRLSQSGDLRPAHHGAELRALYRAGDRRAGAVRRRPGRDALARPRGARARAVRRDRDRRGALHHAEHRRAPPHASARSWCSSRSRSGPGCGGRSARFWRCRC